MRSFFAHYNGSLVFSNQRAAPTAWLYDENNHRNSAEDDMLNYYYLFFFFFTRIVPSSNACLYKLSSFFYVHVTDVTCRIIIRIIHAIINPFNAWNVTRRSPVVSSVFSAKAPWWTRIIIPEMVSENSEEFYARQKYLF